MKVIGYVVAVVGLVLMALGFGMFGDIDLLGVGSWYISGGGIVLIIVGIVFVLAGDRGRGNQKSEEVPIYKGKKIVGYRRG